MFLKGTLGIEKTPLYALLAPNETPLWLLGDGAPTSGGPVEISLSS